MTMSNICIACYRLSLLAAFLCALPVWGTLPFPPYGALGGSYNQYSARPA